MAVMSFEDQKTSSTPAEHRILQIMRLSNFVGTGSPIENGIASAVITIYIYMGKKLVGRVGGYLRKTQVRPHMILPRSLLKGEVGGANTTIVNGGFLKWTQRP